MVVLTDDSPGSAKTNSPPWRGGRPLVPGSGGGLARRRSPVRPHLGQHLHGRTSARSLVAGAGDGATIPGSPACVDQILITVRSWCVSTRAVASPEASRTASNDAVHELRPVSRAKTTKYGQPGII